MRKIKHIINTNAQSHEQDKKANVIVSITSQQHIIVIFVQTLHLFLNHSLLQRRHDDASILLHSNSQYSPLQRINHLSPLARMYFPWNQFRNRVI